MKKNYNAGARKMPLASAGAARPKRLRKPVRKPVDGRRRDVKRWRSLYTGYLAQAGARHEQLCRTAATLALRREQLDAACQRGELVADDHLIRISGALARVLAKLGIGQPPQPRSKLDRLIAAVREVHPS